MAVQGRELLKPSQPMASFARMVSGEWRVTYQSGTGKFDRWHWGPGKHSINMRSIGLGAGGEQWRSQRVVYWHPEGKQIRTLGLSPYARSVSEGTMEWEGESAEAVSDLYQQAGVHRKMGLRWVFDGADQYHETMLEDSGSGLQPFNELTYARSKRTQQPSPHSAHKAPGPSIHLKALEPLLYHTWVATKNWAETDSPNRWTFEYVPYADYIYARMMVMYEKGGPLHLIDTYLYHHTGEGKLRCLMLSDSGGVAEGEVSVLEGGALQANLKSYEGNEVTRIAMRFDFPQDGSLRERVWTVAGTERTLKSDTHFKSLGNTE